MERVFCVVPSVFLDYKRIVLIMEKLILSKAIEQNTNIMPIKVDIINRYSKNLLFIKITFNISSDDIFILPGFFNLIYNFHLEDYYYIEALIDISKIYNPDNFYFKDFKDAKEE